MKDDGFFSGCIVGRWIGYVVDMEKASQDPKN